MRDFEYLVVGSGPAGVMAAQTLLERGKDVVVLDAGLEPARIHSIQQGKTFQELHREDAEQWKYMLGEDLESLQVHGVGSGSHLSGSRKHLVSGIDTWMPFDSKDFHPVESLSTGGLGQAWGLGSFVYSDEELHACGLPVKSMHESYQTIVRRIGVSAGNDDLKPWINKGMDGLMPPIRRDALSESVMRRYYRRKDWFNERGVHMGSSSLAVLTQPHQGRPALKYDELEFYKDSGAEYRPTITLAELLKNSRFRHLNGMFLLSFHEEGEFVHLKCIDRKDGSEQIIRVRKLILACGTLATARIVMRSKKIRILPFLSNPYQYLPTLFLSQIGRKEENRRSALAQSMMMIERGDLGVEHVMVSLYTYGSLLKYRLVQEVPLVPFKEAIHIVKYLAPALLIAGVHHPDAYSPNKRLELIPDSNSPSGDSLKIHYEMTDMETERMTHSNLLVRKALRALGGIPIRTIDPGHGSSIHYAGILPFDLGDSEGMQSLDGKLKSTSNVYIADASGFAYLPSKGITLSIMANAHRIATSIE